MLTYTKGCGGCFLLCHLVGVSWPVAIPPAIICAALGHILGSIKAIDDVIVDEAAWVENPYPLQLFVYMVAVLLIFRTNFAYLRYWESLDAVQRMGAKWHDAVCMSVSFDAPGDETMPYLSGYNWMLNKPNGPVGARHEIFFNELVHLFSLMHGLALQHLRGDGDLDNLLDYYDLPVHAEKQYCISEVGHEPERGVLIRPASSRYLDTPFERPPPRRSSVTDKVQVGLTNLARFSDGHVIESHKLRKLRIIGKISKSEDGLLRETTNGDDVGTLARVGMVESWIMRRWVARQKFEPMGDMGNTSPPILSRLWQMISDGNLAFSQACKAAETPFPFPYQNLLRVFIWILVFLLPFFVNSQVFHTYARLVINFMAVFAYFALCEVGDNLEDPYLAYDPNELPLQSIQHDFNTRLLAMGVLPKVRPEPEEKAQVADPVGVAAGAAAAEQQAAPQVQAETIPPETIPALPLSSDSIPVSLVELDKGAAGNAAGSPTVIGQPLVEEIDPGEVSAASVSPIDLTQVAVQEDKDNRTVEQSNMRLQDRDGDDSPSRNVVTGLFRCVPGLCDPAAPAPKGACCGFTSTKLLLD